MMKQFLVFIGYTADEHIDHQPANYRYKSFFLCFWLIIWTSALCLKKPLNFTAIIFNNHKRAVMSMKQNSFFFEYQQ